MKEHAHCIPTMPWLNSHHPMQSNHIFHVALQTAFCGSLTTFASWNSQMVIMLLGAGSDKGSSKVGQALMGYLLGIICSLSSFQFGRHLGRLFHLRGGIDADATDSSSTTTGAHPNTGVGIIEKGNDGRMPQDVGTEEKRTSMAKDRDSVKWTRHVPGPSKKWLPFLILSCMAYIPPLSLSRSP
jgi:hypothetical protein